MDQAATLKQIARDKKAKPAGRIRAKTSGHGSKPYVVSITSGKGGVGKTNITANLAYILAKMKKRILIFDADCGLANIDLILGLTPAYNLHHVLKGEKTLRETIIDGPGGIKILPASSGIPEMATLSMEQKLFLQDEFKSLQSPPDLLLIDTSAGITENVMYFNMVATQTIVVVTPEPTSLTDAYALIKILYRQHAKKRFSLLVNMVKSQDEAKEVYLRLAQATNHFLNLAIEHLGHVLYDENMPKAVKQQRLLAEIHPASPSVQCLRNVAEKLCQPSQYEEYECMISLFN
ncbi:MAG: MinD/ParA family protein [Syntrophobacterales bacterium]|nr:MAG: MinD/ParA family protein [Syntrophobacterales bacterium]